MLTPNLIVFLWLDLIHSVCVCSPPLRVTLGDVALQEGHKCGSSKTAMYVKVIKALITNKTHQVMLFVMLCLHNAEKWLSGIIHPIYRDLL